MRKVEYTPVGVCSRKVTFELDDDNRIHNLQFVNGCPGNLKAIGLLCENRQAEEVAQLLAGNTCGLKNTSCADQLSKAIISAINSTK